MDGSTNTYVILDPPPDSKKEVKGRREGTKAGAGAEIERVPTASGETFSLPPLQRALILELRV